jgi:hypothetical protein
MKAPIRPNLAEPKRFNWHHRHTRDALVILGIGAIIFAVADIYELPPHLLQFGLDHADWEIDDLIFVVFMLSAAMMIFGFRRYQDLASEIKARTVADLEALKWRGTIPLPVCPIAASLRKSSTILFSLLAPRDSLRF